MNYLTVIEQAEGLIISNKLFMGDDAVERAEKHFKYVVRENTQAHDDDISDHLDNGYCEEGGWMVSISWPEIA